MTDSPGWRRLKAHPDFKGIVERTLEEQKRAIAEVARQPVKGAKLHGTKPRKEGEYPKTKA